jgi:hypothetical protein
MRFEYLVKTSYELYNASKNAENFDWSVELTELGSDGWELVNTIKLPSDGKGFFPLLFFFKRAVA